MFSFPPLIWLPYLKFMKSALDCICIWGNQNSTLKVYSFLFLENALGDLESAHALGVCLWSVLSVRHASKNPAAFVWEEEQTPN